MTTSIDTQATALTPSARNIMRQLTRTAATLSTLLLVLFAACTKDDAAGADDGTAAADSSDTGGSAPVVLPVVGEEVRVGDLVLSVTTTGQVRSEASASMRIEIAGTVTEVLIRPGQQVRKGQPMVRLDTIPFTIAVREAEAALDVARLQLRDNIMPDSIVNGRMPTGDRLRNAEIRAGLPAAQARLDKARLDRERATIIAPFDGTIDQVKVSPGERASAGTEVAVVVDLTNLRIEASVLEHDLPFIRVGGDATITTAAAPGQAVSGRISAILPLVDSTTRAGRAIINVRNPGSASSGGPMLRPGMYADVRLEATRLTGRTVVPARAVIERDGRPLVFVVRDGRAQWTYIQPGRTNGLETEVQPDSVSGLIPLKAGDIVLIDGHVTLTHDAPVRLIARAERQQ
ncbi:MAG: efflux RND transporter periplasmic adaptor subunit [Gemmatimonadota bacterium]|nr:efflux RND transporter periplasmic adaptor subunit [Gemmatimonadota bacterium]